MTSAADLLGELVQAVDLLEYDGASFTFTISTAGWMIGGDVGSEVDDVVDWVGEDLPTALTVALVDVRARLRRATFDHGQPEDLQRCLRLAGRIWLTVLAQGDWPMLDVAYIPRSEVVHGRSWEVWVHTLGLEHGDWGEQSLLEMLDQAWAVVQARGV